MNLWPFGNKEANEEKKRLQALQAQEQADQAASVQAMERGELPLKARKRLEESRQGPHKLFTSDYSTQEFLLAKAAGYETLGLVMGSAFYKTGFSDFYTAPQPNGELWGVTKGRLALRQTALKRLEQEAALLGAHGVVGVEITVQGVDWATGLTEYSAVGTAIRIPGRPAPERPFTCDLSVVEFEKLRAAGYWPVGLVYGLSVQYVENRFFYGFNPSNREITEISQIFADARAWAGERLEEAAHALGAHGVVGAAVSFEDEVIEYTINDTEYRDLMVEFFARGTAVVHDPHPLSAPSAAPLMMMPLTPRAKA